MKLHVPREGRSGGGWEGVEGGSGGGWEGVEGDGMEWREGVDGGGDAYNLEKTREC